VKRRHLLAVVEPAPMPDGVVLTLAAALRAPDHAQLQR
jgi:hypothetical protein